jgi:hypothetical protein
MSYQSRKKKKGLFSQIKYRFGLAKIALFKINKKVERRKDMRLRQTNAVMTYLRERSRIVRPNNIRISEWVDEYINSAAMEGRPVEMLTQLCVSKDLEMRCQEQGGIFFPTRKERLLFARDIPQVADIFQKNGLAFNWWLTFNQSYLDSGRISDEFRRAYASMITELARPLVEQGWLLLADWEDDVLAKRPGPNKEVLAAIDRFVKPEALALEIQRHSSWAREEAGLNQSDSELRRDVYFQIACEAEEGRYLSSDAPFCGCLLVPLESPERYDFFTLLVSDFKKRIVAVLPPYPWRLKEAD